MINNLSTIFKLPIGLLTWRNDCYKTLLQLSFVKLVKFLFNRKKLVRDLWSVSPRGRSGGGGGGRGGGRGGGGGGRGAVGGRQRARRAHVRAVRRPVPPVLQRGQGGVAPQERAQAQRRLLPSLVL